MNIVKVISDLINQDITYMFLLSATAPEAYSTFYINKKSGGIREISQPSKEVKEVQYVIIKEILSKLPVHECAKAYKKGVGIKQNAVEHLNKEFILKTDFSNFFPSIKPADLEYYFKKNNVEINNLEFDIISKILFKKKENSNKLELCIGAPSSPIISNIVMYEIDELLYSHCKERNISYTRYADDMTFSSNSIEDLKEILSTLKKVIIKNKNPELILNQKKTRLISSGRSRRVTGVILSNEGKLSVGRTKRRRTRTLLHLLSKSSIDDKSIIELYSNISFIRNIEPEFYQKLLSTHGQSTFNKLNKSFQSLIEKNTDNNGFTWRFGINGDSLVKKVIYEDDDIQF
ncbi:retron St85 family RNA-directed DNA polymerase [Vibrio parahaemolyticus]|uniref:retron St85 family RNA-directed DNA polymerase n=1 Tax=Vibrio parahaemolyticus TaxID=670 RepID=UPI00235F5BDA|nr:retron St85 family RNA-directed DNA polymerase [Vibrio parahaemolyticus]EIA1588319.1 retron St85 family RNA-directed DNA polymerase [Vibrio parahaemolyticus]EJG0778552.1 retron St85 family RNA-directed DNA polymerase [Vibrio parahaemolyticus]